MNGFVDVLVDAVLVAGIPLLFGLFVLEGLVFGKVLQPPAVFVGVVAITRPGIPYLAAATIGCTVAVVLGQWLLVRHLDGEGRSWPRIEALPGRIGQDRLRTMDRLFVRYGGIGIFLGAFVPLVRATIAVPAGLSSYPTDRFVLVTVAANLVYFPLLAVIALGTLRLLGG